MSSTATLNIRLPEQLKEHGMQVLSKQKISVSDAVRNLFYELERTQEVPEFLQNGALTESVSDKRMLLRMIAKTERRNLEELDPPIEATGHDWREDWHQHLLEKYTEEKE